MRWKIYPILMVAVLIAFAMVSPPTHAAGPFMDPAFPLEESDLALMKTAASKLYLTDGAEVGAVEEWTNPETGSHGTVELIEKHEFKGLPCRRLQHNVEFKRVKNPYRFTLLALLNLFIPYLYDMVFLL